MWYKCQPFSKSSFHEMFVELRDVDINKGLYPVIVVSGDKFCFRKSLKLFKVFVKFLNIFEIKISTDQVMHPLNIMCGLYLDHRGFLLKKVNPLLGVPIIHQKILKDKSKPAIAL